MRAPEPIPAIRVVGPASLLDGMWTDKGSILRVAPDEALVLGDTAVVGDEPTCFMEFEHGLVGWWLAPDELAGVLHHLEWSPPTGWPALAQGLVAGVPATLWFETESRHLLLVAAAYAHELMERLS